MSKIELKPCPFCGGKARLFVAFYENARSKLSNAYRVNCINCGVTTNAYKSDIRQEDDGTVAINKNGAEMAAEAWNKRAEPPSCYRPSTAIETHTDLDPAIQNKVGEILDSLTELASMLSKEKDMKEEKQ